MKSFLVDENMGITTKDIIKCDKVSKQFGYFFALKKISFNIKEHTIFGIAGANGAGKTTLIKILSGMLNPTYGKVLVGGLGYDHHSIEIKQDIGITSDESFLYEELTIFENLQFYNNLHLNFEKKDTQTKIEKFTKKFNLSDWTHEPVSNLSHGMKQKVEIIRTLMHQPSILFLDEPFSGLDHHTTKMFISFLKELTTKEKITIILTTHRIGVFQQICDEIIILKKGRINKKITRDDPDFQDIEIESFF